MKTGDNIYFFTNRKIYGIGELICKGNDCKFVNYPTASTPFQESYENISKEMILMIIHQMLIIVGFVFLNLLQNFIAIR